MSERAVLEDEALQAGDVALAELLRGGVRLHVDRRITRAERLVLTEPLPNFVGGILRSLYEQLSAEVLRRVPRGQLDGSRPMRTDLDEGSFISLVATTVRFVARGRACDAPLTWSVRRLDYPSEEGEVYFVLMVEVGLPTVTGAASSRR